MMQKPDIEEILNDPELAQLATLLRAEVNQPKIDPSFKQQLLEKLLDMVRQKNRTTNLLNRALFFIPISYFQELQHSQRIIGEHIRPLECKRVRIEEV